MGDAEKKQVYSTQKAMQQYAAEILHRLPLIDRTEEPEKLRETIYEMLSLLGKCSGSRRTYFYDRDMEKSDRYCVGFQWQGEEDSDGCFPLAFSLSEFPAWKQKFLAGENVVIRDSENVRDTMPAEYEVLKKQKIETEIMIPVFQRNELCALIGLENPYSNITELFIQQVWFIGAHVNAARENLRLTRAAQQNLEDVEKERQMLRVLSADSTSVYHVDLMANTAEVVKIEKGANFTRILHEKQVKPLCYYDEITKYYQHFVIRSSAPDLLEVFEPQHLMQELQKKDQLCYRFQSIPNGLDQVYFEMRATKMKQTESTFEILVDFREIDEIISEERKHQRELEVALEETRKLLGEVNDANRANEAKSEFLSRMSHDIRTPMNAIMGFANLAREHINEKEKVEGYLSKILLSGKNLEQLINDVLDISRIESGEFNIIAQPVDLVEQCTFYHQTVLALAKEKEIDCEFRLHHLQYKNVLADQRRLSQIYMNLLSNAVKYTPEGGAVSFELYEEQSEKEGKIRLVSIVKDNGIGMSEEFMKEMYSEFSRAVDTRVNTVRGSGLGLAIVKKIVDLMAGTIEVESQLHKGTTFRVILELPYIENVVSFQPKRNLAPAGENVSGTQEVPEDRILESTVREAERRSFPEKAEGLAGRQITLLVAEDNDLNYEILEEQLKMYGICCVRAVDGAECVRRFQQAEEKTFDAILMDMQMPRMNGLEATRQIRQLPDEEAGKIPIIALTANAYHEDMEKCIEAGMNAHLAKPLHIEKVLQTLQIQLQINS